jgi:hypothetical protein
VVTIEMEVVTVRLVVAVLPSEVVTVTVTWFEQVGLGVLLVKMKDGMQKLLPASVYGRQVVCVCEKVSVEQLCWAWMSGSGAITIATARAATSP